MKITAAIGIFVLLFALSLNARADNKHHKHVVIQESNVTNVYTDSQGIASAISAAQCHMDNGSFDLQLCGGVGYSGSQEAVTFGIGKKFNDILFNGTITTEDNQATYGFGINLKIK